MIKDVDTSSVKVDIQLDAYNHGLFTYKASVAS